MISFDFDYYRPTSLREAVELFRRLDDAGKRPLYLSGGTEIVTLGKTNQVYTEAVIDVKRIPECRTLADRSGRLIFGSALTLSEIADARVFPLLGETSAGIADRTSRNKITLGGNICGRFIYKEAVLPLLLADSQVWIAGPEGDRQAPLGQLFDRTLRIRRGELAVQFSVEVRYAAMPYAAVKKRKVSAIDYPLVTLAAMKTGAGCRFAFSGLCEFPFRSEAMEQVLNRHELAAEDRVKKAMALLPAPILSDIKGSAAYREWVTHNVLFETLTAWGG